MTKMRLMLSALRFFFCALLPEFAHTDVLRLQALHDPDPSDFYPNLVNETARRLGRHIREDIGLQTEQ